MPELLDEDKRICAPILHVWSEAGRAEGDAEDRMFFRALHDNFMPNGASNKASVYCVIKPEDGMHPIRESWLSTLATPLSGYASLRTTHSPGLDSLSRAGFVASRFRSNPATGCHLTARRVMISLVARSAKSAL